MIYRATAYTSLGELKMRHGWLASGGGGVGILVVSLLSQFFALELVMGAFIVVLLLICTIGMAGVLPLPFRHHRVTLTPNEIALENPDGEKSVVPLAALNPSVREKSFRAMWPLPVRINYLVLEVDGGLLGARTFYFVHDGDYAAKAWAHLGIEKVLSTDPQVQLSPKH